MRRTHPFPPQGRRLSLRAVSVPHRLLAYAMNVMPSEQSSYTPSDKAVQHHANLRDSSLAPQEAYWYILGAIPGGLLHATQCPHNAAVIAAQQKERRDDHTLWQSLCGAR